MKYLVLSINGTAINPPAGIISGGIGTFQHILQVGIEILLILVAILALVYIIWGGFKWMVSGGDKQQITTAKTQLTFAIIGLVIALAGFVIVNLVGSFFSVPL